MINKENLLDKARYEWIGSVIQKVDTPPSAGKILFSCRKKNTAENLEEYNKIVNSTSLDLWLEFFKETNLKELSAKGSKNWTPMIWEVGSKVKERYNIAS
jgi:hypothetical protein